MGPPGPPGRKGIPGDDVIMMSWLYLLLLYCYWLGNERRER